MFEFQQYRRTFEDPQKSTLNQEVIRVVAYNNAKKVEKLLHQGADVDTRLTNQTTLLMEAARKGYAKILAILLDHGASLHAKDAEGNFAIHYAAENGKLKCLQLLMAKGSLAVVGNLSFKTPLMKAAENGHADVIRYFLENGVKMAFMLNKNLESELTLAADSNKLEVVKILLNPLYTEPYIDRSDELNYVLRSAVEKKNVKLAELLLEAGADPNYVNSEDYPYLFTAIGNGDLEMVKCLISYGAYINLLNWDDVTPLMAAIETDNAEIVEYIISAGADTTLENSSTISALDMATDKGNERILEALKIVREEH